MFKLRKILIAMVFIFFGGVIASVWITPTIGLHTHKTIGFLPYWLINSAQQDYSDSLTTLTYFGLTIDSTGKIVKKVNERELEPGWNALHSGKLDERFRNAKERGLELSLLVSNMNAKEILTLIADATESAHTLVDEVDPIMKEYGFTDLNLDFESFSESTGSAQAEFTEFVRQVKRELLRKELGTLTIEIIPATLFYTSLIDPIAIGSIADTIVLMTYDYHYSGSFISGPVAPLYGAPQTRSFDVQTVITQAERVFPVKKLVLGLPLYGYEWETITDVPGAPVIPGSGRVATHKRVEELLQNCASCSATTDRDSGETSISYPDPKDDSHRIIYYGEASLIKDKLDLVPWWQGAAVWALGYEGSGLLQPLTEYKQQRLLFP